MAMGIKDLCRLCAKKEELSKDLLDINNKNVLTLVQDLIHLTVNENDGLPTKVCLNCEEKIVSFQLFILECYKIQDSLKKLYIEHFPIKEETVNEFGDSNHIKSEVKDEVPTEDIILDAIENDNSLPEYDDGELDFLEEEDTNDVTIDEDKKDSTHIDEDDENDNVTLAELKKDKKCKKKNVKPEETPELNEVLKRPVLKVRDFVKMQCDMCKKKAKTWIMLQDHYMQKHKCKLYVNCVCGYVIKSKSVLYKHVLDHKMESERLKGKQEINAQKETNVNYSGLKVKDFVDFTCNICKKTFSSWYKLKSHTQKIHGTQPVVRCICGISLTSKTVLYKHVQDHRNPDAFCCDKCPRIHRSLEALNKHKMKHIPKADKKFYCNTCDKIFNTKESLKSHERSHIPIEDRKIYRCDICDLKFTTRSSAASHKRVVHDKIKSYVCDLCGYACGTNGELRQHRAIHSEDKPFVCEKCYKSFKTHSNLSTHMDTHEHTSYTCDVCNRVLNSRRTLRKHLLVHEERCKHVCSFCHKAFKRRQTLKVHLYTHTGDKPLTCKWCDERFAYASTLRSHRLRCHADKMALPAQPASYQHYTPVPPQEYIKSDLAAIGITKNEGEAM